ncbi:MAG: hypothetical protein ACRYGO_14790 [Janthinobacterium lividum]
MKTFKRITPRPTRLWAGLAALLLGGAAAAAPSPSAGARAPGIPAATAQLMAQAEAQAAQAINVSAGSVPCTRKHQHGLRYSVLRLATQGRDVYLNAVNNHGWVVGDTRAASGHLIPTLWIGGQAFDLGNLGGRSGGASDINDRGQVVGASSGADDVSRAFLWYRGRMTALGNLDGGAARSSAHGINRAGVVSGESAIPVSGPGSLQAQAVLWRNGVPRALPGVGGGARAGAYRINDAGYSVGFGYDAATDQHAIFWTPKGEAVSLGTNWIAVDINNARLVAGYAFVGRETVKPVTWYRGLQTILPTLGGENGTVYGINEHGHAVGASETPTGQERATLWLEGRPVQIDTLLVDGEQGMAIAAAYAINDKGQIAAVQRLPDNVMQPLLLTPRRCHGK